eukprot:326617-Prymnesium_polylepis.2
MSDAPRSPSAQRAGGPLRRACSFLRGWPPTRVFVEWAISHRSRVQRVSGNCEIVLTPTGTQEGTVPHRDKPARIP